MSVSSVGDNLGLGQLVQRLSAKPGASGVSNASSTTQRKRKGHSATKPAPNPLRDKIELAVTEALQDVPLKHPASNAVVQNAIRSAIGSATSATTSAATDASPSESQLAAQHAKFEGQLQAHGIDASQLRNDVREAFEHPHEISAAPQTAADAGETTDADASSAGATTAAKGSVLDTTA